MDVRIKGHWKLIEKRFSSQKSWHENYRQQRAKKKRNEIIVDLISQLIFVGGVVDHGEKRFSPNKNWDKPEYTRTHTLDLDNELVLTANQLLASRKRKCGMWIVFAISTMGIFILWYKLSEENAVIEWKMWVPCALTRARYMYFG